MTSGTTKTAILTAMAGVALASSPAKANEIDVEPIRVGIIDTSASAVHSPMDNVFVKTKSFLGAGRVAGQAQLSFGHERGAEAANAFVAQSRLVFKERPVEIYSASVYYRTPDGGSKLDPEAARKALEWFKQNNVQVVLAPALTPDTPGITAFMQKAAAMDMTVVSSNGNNSASAAGASFQVGSIPTLRSAPPPIQAAGRVAAFAAYVRDIDPSLDQTGVAAAMRTVAGSERNPSFDGSAPVSRLRVSLRLEKPKPSSIAKGPVGGAAEIAMLDPRISRSAGR